MTLSFSPPRSPARLLHRWLMPAALLASAGAASAAIINVPADQPTIQAAVTAAASGDTIQLADGTYTGPGNVDTDTGSKSLAIRSVHGAAATIINCGGTPSAGHYGFYVSAPSTSLTLSGLTIKNGDLPNGAGGAIYNTGTLTLTGCVLSGNSVANPNAPGTNSNSGGALFNSGTATLSGCTVSGNSANYGGGIYSLHGTGISLTLNNCTLSGNAAAGNSAADGSRGGYGGGVYAGSAMTATNCVFSGNTTDYAAGGLLVGGASVTALTNCTLAGNSAPVGNGGGFVVFGKAAFTNTIVYGNTGGSADDGDTTAAITYSDIQGGYLGTGNISADPKFAGATDFHLSPTSLCLGAGTINGAPETDIDNSNRPNPPSMGAYDIAGNAAPVTPPTHILWNNADGTASLWNYNPVGGSYTHREYGPFGGYTATATADGGTDGRTRMLWNKTDGIASVWSLDNAAGQFVHFEFGPFTGYTATALSVATDNTTHLLWDSTDGTASVWNYNAASGSFTHREYGPYAGYTAKAIADGPDGKSRLLWTKADGTASLWSFDNTAGTFTHFEFGPYAGYTASGVSVGADGATHVLWDNANGAVSVWNYNPADGSFTHHEYGPYAGWTAKAVSDGANGKTRLLWDNTDGRMSLWGLDNTTGIFGQFTYGPYSGWTANAVSGF